MLLESLNGEDAVIDSIRTPGEVEALRKRSDFVLIEIRAGVDSRWRRSQDRGRIGDPTDKQRFLAQEKAEEVASDEAGQALNATAALSDLVIINEGGIEELYSDLEDLWPTLAKLA